ncbi:ER protein Pkr1-domain-containing protein [Ilyonectria robusta]|uniref:ER protein Pkr1-domain-containing protein n=1 Tax=Ilyonectria robusta TaxID=1079257 RepID=UPI001E8E3276|nr:ER protein Pkr1-domain-containing protein [Ilyonectria robusta]KAH8737017.1 ER protein Pkr1-domain-containing protein [Ilyonectria robusta]
MASFMVDLWEGIFTPGPTPTLLKATNASFAALQLVLFLLLLATYSVHFVVLTILCAGLWWSVNWFATELYAVQAREREEEAKRKEKEGEKQRQSDADDDTETEVESADPAKKPVPGPVPVPAAPVDAGLEPIDPRGEVTHRPGPGTQSSASTEDEWEKVSENENDKDK